MIEAMGYTSEFALAEVTEDFIESFKDTTDFSGGFFGLMKSSKILPNGVDPKDKRVQEILKRLEACQTKNSQ